MGEDVQKVIIAGTNKSGTTSLFRYLADHPEVCASRVKEANFFATELQGSIAEQRQAYTRCFPECGAEKSLWLEATPSYLGEGRKIAARIHAVVPDVKLIFILREPVARLMSFFHQNSQSKFNKGLGNYTLGDYVELTEKVHGLPADQIETGPPANARLQFQRGCYASCLNEYLEYFPKENILPLFFDDLSANTAKCVADAATFLDIDGGFFQDYVFRTENKTRKYKYPQLHTLGSRINKMMESTLNRHSGLRNSLRRVYLSFNEQKGKANQVAPEMLERLGRLYEPENARLLQLLEREYPALTYPAWVRNMAG